MRVLIYTGLTHWGRGGVQRETERLLAALVERGIETGFAVDRPVDIPGLVNFPLSPERGATNGLTDAIREFQPDIVHMIGGGAKSIVATDRACRNTSRKWVVTVHNVPPRERSGPFWLGNNRWHYWVRNAVALPSILLWRLLLRIARFSRVIVHSSEVQHLVRDCGCAADRISLVPLGADALAPPAGAEHVHPGSPFPDDAHPRVATIAAFAHTKGLHDYLRALAELVVRYPKIHLVWVGAERYDGYERFVLAEIQRLGLASRVTLLKNAGDDVLRATLEAADLYVQPSHEEGFCLSYIEGAQTVPLLLGTSTGAIREISEGDPWARVVPPGDVDGMVENSLALLALPRTNADAVMAARNARLTERFSWNRYTEQHIAIYRSVAAKPVSVTVRP